MKEQTSDVFRIIEQKLPNQHYSGWLISQGGKANPSMLALKLQLNMLPISQMYRNDRLSTTSEPFDSEKRKVSISEHSYTARPYGRISSQ